MILKNAGRRFDITAVGHVKLIGEGVFDTLPFLNAACNPFVPAGDEDEFGINLQRIFKLLGEVGTPKHRILARIVALRGVGASEDTLAVHRGKSCLGGMVLRHADGHLLRRAVLVVIDLLRINGQPAPVVFVR